MDTDHQKSESSPDRVTQSIEQIEWKNEPVQVHIVPESIQAIVDSWTAGVKPMIAMQSATIDILKAFFPPLLALCEEVISDVDFRNDPLNSLQGPAYAIQDAERIAEAMNEMIFARSGKQESMEINLDNYRIVIHGRKATVLPETCWDLLRRIYYSKNRTTTLDNLCDRSKGDSMWYNREHAPCDRSLSNYAQLINEAMENAGISIRVKYEDEVFSLHQITSIGRKS